MEGRFRVGVATTSMQEGEESAAMNGRQKPRSDKRPRVRHVYGRRGSALLGAKGTIGPDRVRK